MADENLIQQQGEEGGQPVTLPLSNYRLTLEILEAHTPSFLVRKRSWDRPGISFLAWQEGALQLQLKWRHESYKLTIEVGEEQLLVFCSCGTMDDALCLHAFKAIQSLVYYRGEEGFKRYRPGGEVAIAFQHREYFKVEWNFYRLDISAKDSLGDVYIADNPRHHWLATALPSIHQAKPGTREKVACYFIIEWHREERLPVLIPGMGTLSRDGQSIKSFDPFFSATRKENDHLLTEEQRVLNLLCYQVWKETEDLPGSVSDIVEPEGFARLANLYGLWKQAFCFLVGQPHIFHYRLWRCRYLKEKPVRKRTKRIRPCPEPVSFALSLKEYKAYYQLSGIAKNYQGRSIPQPDAGLPFFIRSGNTFYFLSSLGEGLVAAWMHSKDYRLTVFRELYPAFEKGVLLPLKKQHSIELLRK